MGVALLFASQIAGTSLNHSVAQLVSQDLGTMRLQLAARGPQGFNQRLLGKVQRIPGVTHHDAGPEERANLIGPTGESPSSCSALMLGSRILGGPLLGTSAPPS